MAPDFLTDLDGDGAAELIAGTNGYALTQCLTCTVGMGDGALYALSFGLWAATGAKIGTCAGDGLTCFSSNSIVGPNETDGATFPTTHANGLTTASINDSMFAFSVAADWAPTGRTSFLQLWPPKMISLPGQPWFTNSHITMLTMSQFGGALATASQATYQSVFFKGNISTADATNIQYLNGAAGSGRPPRGDQPWGI